MREIKKRLQFLEATMGCNAIPTFEEFQNKWNTFDELSQAVLIAEAESTAPADLCGWWGKYLSVIRGYLLKMELLNTAAPTFRQVAAEMEGALR